MAYDMKGKTCLECAVSLETRNCTYLPGGIAYICPVCNVEYTPYMYKALEEQLNMVYRMTTGENLIDSQNKESENKKIVLGDDKDNEKLSVELKALLEETADLSPQDDIIASYEKPIEEV